MRTWPLVLVLLVALACPGGHASAQSLAETGATWFGQSEVVSRDGGEIDGSADVGLTLVHVRAGVPTQLNDGRTLILNGLAYEGLHPRVSSMGQNADTNTFHSLAYELSLSQQLGERWSLMVGARPGLAGDFTSISGDDFVFLGSVLAGFAASDSVTFGFGAGLTTLLGAKRAVPFLQLGIDPPGPFYLQAMLPSQLDVGAQVPVLRAGARARIRGGVYNRAATEPDDDVLRVSLGALTAFVAFDLPGPLWLEFEGGTTFLRRFELEVDGETFDGFDAAGGPVFGAALKIAP